jgi:hypothetical protein
MLTLIVHGDHPIRLVVDGRVHKWPGAASRSVEDSTTPAKNVVEYLAKQFPHFI